MSKSNQKPVALAMCTALAGGIVLAGSAFAMEPLSQGYLLAAQDAKAADAKTAEGKCGEGKCGIEKADTDKDGKVSKAEFDTAHPGKSDKFTAIDTNKDGFIDAAEAKAHHEGKCGEGKCGGDTKDDAKAGDKAAHEGKCGEGKCGGAA
ncbi:HvfA family oxazolone/thioamide-modified RiPP metallophore [Pseudoxanthomonas sp.]|uniref:HvfA family oxazolone/thioamide-modified RiPP metallophore n=1 Tax=Pseudoxanthomonas sp. TaxID=1871049 RepID=UPI003F7FF92D